MNGGASVGTCAFHIRVLTGTISSLVVVGLRRASLIAAASSPAGAIAGPIRKMTHRSRWLSFGIRDANAHVSVTAGASTWGTNRPRIRGGSFRLQKAALGVQVTWKPVSLKSSQLVNSPVNAVRN